MVMDKNKKLITIFISSFRSGGGEKMMVELAGALAHKEYRVDLVVMKNEGPLLSQVDPLVRVVDLKVGRIIFSPLNFKDYLILNNPDVVMSLDEYTHLVSLLSKRLAGSRVRIVLRVGNMYSELFRRYGKMRDRFLIPILVRKFYKQADKIIAVSNGVADDITSVADLDKNKVVVVYNPKSESFISKKTAEPVGHSWVERKSDLLIVAVGRLREQKNFSFLIKSFNRVRAQINCRLIIVGAGREEERLRELTRDLKCEDYVSLPGYTDNPYRYLAKADVFVSASLWEGMPNGVLEAITCGAPAIVSDCDSGPREILAPDTDYRLRLSKGFEMAEFGVLCAVGDEDGLVDALLRIIKDDQLRQTYSLASRKRAKDFDFDLIISKYEEVLVN